MAGERLQQALNRYRHRYAAAAGKKEKGEILDEFCRLSGYHRKYALCLLQPGREVTEAGGSRRRGVSYSPEALRVIESIWRAAGYPWSVRLKGMLPIWLPWAKKQRGGISPEVERQVLSISTRQLDRRLMAKKRKLKGRLYGRCKPGTLLKHLVPIRAGPGQIHEPGHAEMDLVSSSGPSARGEFAYTLNVTDLATGWCESGAFLGRSESAVVDTLDGIIKNFPFPVRALNSDNGSEFLNYHLVRYCKRQGIQFTRSRPYKKDDNAHIEQKNWTNVRKLIGWDRYDRAEAVAAMNDLYASVRLMMNLFQPSVRLRERKRVGSRLYRSYEQPSTPLDRLVKSAEKELPEKLRQLLQLRARLDPFELAKEIELKQHKLSRLSAARASLPIVPHWEPIGAPARTGEPFPCSVRNQMSL